MVLIELNAGARIKVCAKRVTHPAQGLAYDAFEGVLIDDAGVSEGWDVVDVMRDDGTEQSIYCFSIERGEDICKHLEED